MFVIPAQAGIHLEYEACIIRKYVACFAAFGMDSGLRRNDK
jgi:hypothetical protein